MTLISEMSMVLIKMSI